MADGPGRLLYLRESERRQLGRVTDDLWRARDRFEDDETDYVPLREDERAVLAPLRNTGYELLDWGLGRIVLRLPTSGGLNDYVVKVGRYGETLLSIGMFQNRSEIVLFHQEGGEDVPLLPPVDWQSGTLRWLVMPYGTPLDAEGIGSDEQETLHSQATDALSTVEQLDDRDFVSPNFVRWKGEGWLADYGRYGPPSLRDEL